MPTDYKTISPELRSYITAQPVFFVATSPLQGDGHINVSPKGELTGLTFLEPSLVADVTSGSFPAPASLGTVIYCDVGGSGIETIAHLRENGRITLMMAEFEDKAPQIIRLFGRGMAVEKGQKGWSELVEHFKGSTGSWPMHVSEDYCRAFIVVDVTRARRSCGGGVPVMNFAKHRVYLKNYTEKLSLEAWEKKLQGWGRVSLDGLPGSRRFGLDGGAAGRARRAAGAVVSWWWAAKWQLCTAAAVAVVASKARGR